MLVQPVSAAELAARALEDSVLVPFDHKFLHFSDAVRITGASLITSKGYNQKIDSVSPLDYLDGEVVLDIKSTSKRFDVGYLHVRNLANYIRVSEEQLKEYKGQKVPFSEFLDNQRSLNIPD